MRPGILATALMTALLPPSAPAQPQSPFLDKYVGQAEQQRDAGDLAAALASVERALERNPRSLRALELQAELARQRDTLILIASENTASPAVMAAAGSWFTNKYAEGYPGRRYYGGCAHLDVCERLARERACELFGAEHANVQPHSGTQANLEVYGATLEPGDTLLGMDLSHGGHLTHGHPLNFSGKYFKVVPYGVRKEDERIDYEALEKLAVEHRPKIIVVGASAYPRTIDFEAVTPGTILDSVNGE